MDQKTPPPYGNPSQTEQQQPSHGVAYPPGSYPPGAYAYPPPGTYVQGQYPYPQGAQPQYYPQPSIYIYC